MTAKVHPGVVLQWECLMKHYQSKYQPPLLRFVVGFLAGLAAWTQVFSGCCQCSGGCWEEKTRILFRQSQHFRQSNSCASSTHVHSEMQTSHCEGQGLCWSLLKPDSSSQAWAWVCLSQQGWDRAAAEGEQRMALPLHL